MTVTKTDVRSGWVFDDVAGWMAPDQVFVPPLEQIGGTTGTLQQAARADHNHGLTVTTTGAPTSGTHQAGEFTVSQDGHIWTCVTSGTPGTWVDASSSIYAGPAYALNTADQTFTTDADLVGASVTFTVTTFPVRVQAWAALVANGTGGQPSKFKITDENGVEKSRNLFFSEVASHGFSPNCWETISMPGTYTRKVQVSHHTGSGTVTVFTLNAPGGAFIVVRK